MNVLLTTILSLSSLLTGSIAQNDDTPSPGARRILRTAESLKSSSSTSPHTLAVAEAWLAVGKAVIGDNPPAGPPDSFTATPDLMATWASACVDAAAVAPLNPDSTAYAETQVELMARLLADVDRTGTEPPDPADLAKVLVLGAALAQSDGNTEAATTFARRAAKAVDWKDDVYVLGVGLLSHVLAETGSCDEIERLSNGVPSWQLPGILVSTAGDPGCEKISTRLLDDQAIIEGARATRLLLELGKARNGATTDALVKKYPELISTPQNRLLAVQAMLSSGMVEPGIELLGGKGILSKLRGYDMLNTVAALAVGEAAQGNWAEALKTAMVIGNTETGILSIMNIQGEMLAKGSIKPEEVLKGLRSLHMIRTSALEPSLARIGHKPSNLDRTLAAMISTNRRDVVFTLLNPKFQARIETGDQWLEKRIGALAVAMTHANSNDIEGWKSLIMAVSRCHRVDSQVRALTAIAMAWDKAHPNDALPNELRNALTDMIVAITVRDAPTTVPGE